jgi:hypothetical protein
MAAPPAGYLVMQIPPAMKIQLLTLILISRVIYGAETLSNGVILPENWPVYPDALTRAPLQEPPYLKEPPKRIPIDVGRQLFVDDFLIETTTLKKTHHLTKYHESGPVFGPDQPWEGNRAAVFSDGVWFDPQDHIFKAWYWTAATSQKPLHFATCYATSEDGIHWKKPSLDVVPGTNIVLPDTDGLRRNSSTTWMDLFEGNPAMRFKMFRVVQQDFTNENGKATHRNFIQYHVSADGIHWNLAGSSVDCGDRSTVFYNAHRKRWVASLREGSPLTSRCRGYHEAADPLGMIHFGNETTRNHPKNLWIGADELDFAREDLKLRRIESRPWDLVPSQLYNLDCIAYESLLLGMFTIWRGHPVDELRRPKINELCVGFSRDGFHWSRPDRRSFCGLSDDPTAWNFGNLQRAGGCCLIVGNKLFFYVGATRAGAGADPNSTGLAVLRRDGFTSMDADSAEGSLTTRPVVFTGSHLFVNADVKGGSLRAEILDEQGKLIAPFTKAQCIALRGDATKHEIKWNEGSDLAAIAGRPVRLRFHVNQGSFYAFWVSKDATGASQGFVAAGGPGFHGPTD